MNKLLTIVDIQRYTEPLSNDFVELLNKSDKTLSLTPYSSFNIEKVGQKFLTFHDIISINDFKEKNLSIYVEIINNLSEHKDFFYLLRQIMTVITYHTYVSGINQYTRKMKAKGYKIVYLSDMLNSHILVDRVYLINKKRNFLYIKHQAIYYFNKLKYSNNLLRIIRNRIKSTKVGYDAAKYQELFKHCELDKIKVHDISKFIMRLKKILIIYGYESKLLNDLYSNIIFDYKNAVKHVTDNSFQYKPFTYLSNNVEALKAYILKDNQCKVVFFQHGSYIYRGEHSIWCEIYPATINFVVNEFTKKLFVERQAKEIYTIGSELFNYKICDNPLKYDYLYITYCTEYADNNKIFSSFSEDMSIDGNEIYNRHKDVITLFGTKFKDKNICIKIQQGIFLGTMTYVPFLELVNRYKNITIEFSVPIQKLIQKSKYIISDYFSSEFINRELHYKRDIMLFKSTPLSLPKEVLEDMDKMFILIDTIDDLEEKVNSIVNITKNRKRYDDIIEYYSSKKCNTKSVVTEILKKELKFLGDK